MRRYSDNICEPDYCAATHKQEAFLNRNNLHPDRPIDRYEAAHKIGTFVDSRRLLSPTVKQESLLRELGKWREGMNRGEAFDLIRRHYAVQAPQGYPTPSLPFPPES